MWKTNSKKDRHTFRKFVGLETHFLLNTCIYKDYKTFSVKKFKHKKIILKGQNLTKDKYQIVADYESNREHAMQTEQ